MSDLYPTKTRRALLLAVDAGDVVDGPDEYGTIHTWLIDPPYAPRKVNNRVGDALYAGWVRQDGVTWVLTDAGRAVLAAGGGTP